MPRISVAELHGIVKRNVLRQSGANPEIAFFELRHELASHAQKEARDATRKMLATITTSARFRITRIRSRW